MSRVAVSYPPRVAIPTHLRSRGLLGRTLAGRVLVLLLLLGGSVLFIAPFGWMVSTALKDPHQVYAFPPVLIPHPLHWENFQKGWFGDIPFSLFLRNTVIITGNNVLGDVLSSSIVGFSFARLRARGRDVIFMLVLATMMIPHEVTVIPVYLLFAQVGWVNTFVPLMLPSWFAWPFFVFLFRQFFMTLPFELDNAARIDGCSTWGIYWRIVLPLSKPALASVATFSFVANWNDFLQPLIFLSDPNLFTLALGLDMFQGQHFTATELLMAVSTIVILPILAVFLVAQRYFIQGIALTGLKA